MTVEILKSFRLQFNKDLTSELPAKVNPKHQNVVFTKPDGSVGAVFSREVLKERQGHTEEDNLRTFGLSNEELLSGYFGSDYSILRPEAAESLGAFRYTPT